MQMIDVLKRLAELDAKNPNVEKAVVKESTLEECGMMPEMGGMGMMAPSHPPVAANFSINATASSGDEVANMLTQIMTLAGVHKVSNDELGAEPPPAVMTMEPSAGDSMRGVIDKLNPDADPGEEDGELGPFQGNDTDDMSVAQGDVDDDGDHDMDDHDAEDNKEETDETVDSMGADPTDTNEFDPNQFAKTQNTPGQGDRMDGNMPKGNPTPKGNATFESLMKEYKQFIGESDEEVEESDDDMDEGIEDRLKDLDPKNPVNIPAYQRKAKSGDSAAAARNSKESANESMADILKLSGLK